MVRSCLGVRCFAVVASFGLVAGAQAVGLLTPGDFIIGIDTDTPVSASNYPAAENPPLAFDGNVNSKYLNFAENNSGFIVTPVSGPSIVRSLLLTSANDAAERDPATYALYGTNDSIASIDNSLGNGENWTLIAQGAVALPATRLAPAPLITFANANSYTSYRLIFPTVKNAVAANSMQIAEVGLFTSTDGSGTSVLSGTTAALAVDTDFQYGGSAAGEVPAYAMDLTTSQYRNTGGANSGFIVTPWVGPTIVTSFVITTAIDLDPQDPTSYALYGTNEPIASEENSLGDGENWTLISSGALALPTSRITDAPAVEFTNTTAYMSYRMIFPTLRGGPATTAMHIGEIQFDGTIVNPVPTPLLKPNDLIIAVDETVNLVSSSNHPAGEPPASIADASTTTKYLNFGEERSGFIATPAGGASVVHTILFTTANDAEERDPASFELYGTNDVIVSTNNSLGTAENWTLITSGDLALPPERQMPGAVISFANEISYASYRVIFPTVKNAALANSMQIAEVGLFESTDGSGTNVLSGGGPILAIDLDAAPTSSYPGGESPLNAIDGTFGLKYLNFGQAESGFIVTPSLGATRVTAFRVISANDFPGRDPMSWALYGTNDPIVTVDNGNGQLEDWTLISSGALEIPIPRFSSTALIEFENMENYTSYKMIFPTVRDPETANSMQISEVQFYGTIGFPCPTPAADIDEDGDVDQVDFGILQTCYTGLNGSYPFECRCLDRESDGDIDAEDLAAFNKCRTGADIPWTQDGTPDCAP